ncbi:MAG: AAA family ATPase [Spirochaetales bacterium]|nr:MAG: AAA family ATPase [Spirochaetales bacterium]
MELFSQNLEQAQPLAARMRPRNLDEFIGQEHILGAGRLLRRAIQADQLSSIIFYGPPGSGKTTLARVIANTTKSSFKTLNAVLAGVKDLREAIDEAKSEKEYRSRRTILFVDEVHRWNKSQQDALLPWVENGTFILIGATTQNPYFEVNSALVSRSRIFQLTRLSAEDLEAVAAAALADKERGYGKYSVEFEPGALGHLVAVASGDARSLLNALELAIETTPDHFPPPEHELIRISMKAAEESIQQRAVLYDKEGDYHFDTISAFIKSIRGSDPDAALYWLARMVAAGEEPRFIFRRMLILASEDIGMADPRALIFTEAAAAAFDRVGLPEGRYFLANAVLYLATAPKSNSVMGFFDALEKVTAEQQEEVPAHLKDANRDKKGFGHGEGYLYPHAYKDHWVSQQYLPAGLAGSVFYAPSGQGYERSIRTEVARKQEITLQAGFESEAREIYTWSPENRNLERWIARAVEGKSRTLTTIRDRLFAASNPLRHYRVLVRGQGCLYLALEALRHCPEGGVWFLPAREREAEQAVLFNTGLQETEKLNIISEPGDLESGIRFETILGRNLFAGGFPDEGGLARLYGKLSAGGVMALAETIPSQGQRLSGLVPGRLEQNGPGSAPGNALMEKFIKAEDTLYADKAIPALSLQAGDIRELLSRAGFEIDEPQFLEISEDRLLTDRNIQSWFDTDNPQSYGSLLKKTAEPAVFEEIENLVKRSLSGTLVPWKVCIAFFTGRKPQA